MEIKTIKCSSCNQEIIDYPYIRWGHKPYSSPCPTPDGLTYYDFDKEGLKFGVFLVEEINIEARKFFLKKMEMMENEQKSGLKAEFENFPQKTPLKQQKENFIEIDKNTIVINQVPEIPIKRKKFFDMFEIYDDENI